MLLCSVIAPYQSSNWNCWEGLIIKIAKGTRQKLKKKKFFIDKPVMKRYSTTTSNKNKSLLLRQSTLSSCKKIFSKYISVLQQLNKCQANRFLSLGFTNIWFTRFQLWSCSSASLILLFTVFKIRLPVIAHKFREQKNGQNYENYPCLY